MFKHLLALVAASLLATSFSSLFSQNINITYQNPDQLLVCSADTMLIQVQNNTGSAIPLAFLDLELPSGLEYLPGSASGATEFSISTPNNPILSLGALAPGALLTVRVQLYAACGLVEAINSAQLFSVLLRVRAGTITEQLTTTKFQIQTSLLVITQVDNDSVSGEKGEMVVRTLHVRNTRLGAVQHLFIRDLHPAGIDIQVAGALNEQNTPTAYSAYFDGNFFKAFGDQDSLFEFGETILIEEKITITDCGIPSFLCRSKLIAEWSCTPTQAPCQGDSTRADVRILPSQYQPKLVFTPQYALPWDVCAEKPHTMKLRVVNEGPAPATNIILQFRSEAPPILGMDKSSFRVHRTDGSVQQINPNLASNDTMTVCNKVYAGKITLFFPEMLGHDTFDITFDNYYCDAPCYQDLPVVYMNYFYNIPCPVGKFLAADTVQFAPKPGDRVTGFVSYQIGECLADNETYSLFYKLQSNRLLSDTGYLALELDLPRGLFWDDSCQPVLSGLNPVRFTIDTFAAEKFTRVTLAYPLPLPADSGTLKFCLKNICSDSSALKFLGFGYPGPDRSFEIFVPDSCTNFGYILRNRAGLLLDSLGSLDCAPVSCDSSILRSTCPAPDTLLIPDGPVPPVGFPACFRAREHREAYRLNYDLADNDNNRHADPTGILNLDKVRRDRFLPGDTLRSILSTKILCGDSINKLFYQLFTEIIYSDFGHGGAFDTFPIGPSQGDAARLIVAKDLIRVAGATISIWDSSEQKMYLCPIEAFPTDDQKFYGIVTPVNFKPTPAIDQLATMNYPFVPNMTQLADAGYLPTGFLLGAGDSVRLQVDLKLDLNYVPYSQQHNPPLINFEMGYNSNLNYRFYNYRALDTLMFQYSGYLDSLSQNVFNIYPCTNSTETRPFSYNTRIARENMFPYEVRPLAKVGQYRLEIPKGVTPLSVELSFLRLQESVPFLSNLPLPFVVEQDTFLVIDFGPAYVDPPDEGYALRTKIVFAPLCQFSDPDSSFQEVLLAFPNGMVTPDTVIRVLKNKIGFYSNHPRDTMTTSELVLDFPTPAVSADVEIHNLAPVNAPNYYVQLVNPEGGLENISLTVLPGTTITPANGIFQLGTLPVFGVKNLRLNARNKTCDPQRLLLIYGWDCTPYLQPSPSTCGRDTLELLFRPLNPEIELDLKQMPTQAPLCDTSDYIVFEVFNADLGYAYKPFVSIELPPGFQLVPNSCQLAFPTGSAFVNIPNPVAVGGSVLEWNLAALQTVLATEGLAGVNEPNSSLQIRFKVQAECGVVSNAQLIFGARAEWSCGKLTNTLRKASPPLPVEGVVPAYGVQIGISEPAGSGPVLCAEQRTLAVNLLLVGAAEPGDSVYLSLPAGYTYVPGSYAPGNNAVAGEPYIDGSVLRWALPIGLPANTGVSFTLVVRTSEQANCLGATVQAQTRQSTSAFCPTIQANCSVFAATGSSSYTFPANDPDLTLGSYSISTGPDGLVDLGLIFQNNNSYPINALVYRIYHDVDGNGKQSPGDVLLLDSTLTDPILAGGTLALNLPDAFPGADICRLILVLPALENCDCQDQVFPLSNEQVSYAPQSICLGQNAQLGIPAEIGHSYTWTGQAGIPCTDCPEFSITPTQTGLFAFTLTDVGPICTVKRLFSVQVNAIPALLAPDTIVCVGEPVFLSTTAASTWQWSGPGIDNPAEATQTVQPTQSSLYAVTVTDAAGCSATASATVEVWPADSTDLGVVRTCQGTPVDVFGTPTEVPGAYMHQFTNANGCDSLVFLTLELVPNTEEVLPHCVGDTVQVFGEPVTAAGMYCRAFQSSLGCDSTHCVLVTDLPRPDLPDPDTFYIVLGGSVVLPGPDGFAEYHWSPADSLSCTDCQSPVASPIDTTEYTLTVWNGDGCTDTLIYRVVPFPPCDPYRLQVPNAFTPDGDGVNDVFTAVPYEGVEIVQRLAIYNRWGEKVYEAFGPSAAWDGTTGGKPAPSDVYVWILEILCEGERQKPRHGDITVLR
ncbi:MAG: gliding motility-associated C-terminal domain-containing protein [Saprospiraceae bacterium]|nr:gliding motility-associated C-terminal domain-containing protein [Saprospiraceae bacterium]